MKLEILIGIIVIQVRRYSLELAEKIVVYHTVLYMFIPNLRQPQQVQVIDN